MREMFAAERDPSCLDPHLGMGREQVLALLRIDVGSGEDHERLRVDEVDEALLVNITEVADGAHRAVRRIRRRRLL
jgi:hypothetical protein